MDVPSSTTPTDSTISYLGARRDVRWSNSPDLEWDWFHHPSMVKEPRCLLIDYICREVDGIYTGKVVSTELSPEGLERFCHETRGEDVVMRFLHIQNWPVVTGLVIDKYCLHSHGNDEADMSQSGLVDWINQKKPQRRAGKPLLLAKSWGVSSDPQRRITKCAMGFDLMKSYPCTDYQQGDPNETRVTALKGYDENDNPVHRFNVYAQHASVYVQYSNKELQEPAPDVVSPYQSIKSLDDRYDNGNTIILFDNSDSHSIMDTFIPAHGEWESRWSRLASHISSLPGLPKTIDALPGERIRTITQDIFKAVSETWGEVLDASSEHVSILEDKIYEQPANESRAPKLWRNQATWLMYERLIYSHQDTIKNMQKFLVELEEHGRNDVEQRLKEILDDFKKFETLMSEDLAKRTNNLSDFMYKSVGIRDNRESLRLGASMWRLSWITFIFLPLTFLVSFFGMNVSTFDNHPSILWYFVSVIPFMGLVFLLWYVIRHSFATSRDAPPRRGVYEALFSQLRNYRPEMWTRQGLQDEPIGAWDRMKRCLTKRWTTKKELPKDVEANIDSDD